MSYSYDPAPQASADLVPPSPCPPRSSITLCCTFIRHPLSTTYLILLAAHQILFIFCCWLFTITVCIPLSVIYYLFAILRLIKHYLLHRRPLIAYFLLSAFRYLFFFSYWILYQMLVAIRYWLFTGYIHRTRPTIGLLPLPYYFSTH
ncbi:hypothetical protein EDB89DRAFT_1977547 [Lactarius sanguifluus]|nr:hypothetical protein EDB89DRAFT_1977547 [Lactarius sanguifluus]